MTEGMNNALRAIGSIIMLLLIGGVASFICALIVHHAHAAPPVGADPRLAPWFESLTTSEGQSCCGIADCREETRVMSPINSPDRHWWVYIGKELFGPDAPNRYISVPDKAVKIDADERLRPPGPVVCWEHQNPFMAFGVLPPTGSDGAILCFRPSRTQG